MVEPETGHDEVVEVYPPLPGKEGQDWGCSQFPWDMFYDSFGFFQSHVRRRTLNDAPEEHRGEEDGQSEEERPTRVRTYVPTPPTLGS